MQNGTIDGHLADILFAREACRDGSARAIREAAPLSISELSAHLGLSSRTLSRWERGTTVPRGPKVAPYGQTLRELAESE